MKIGYVRRIVRITIKPGEYLEVSWASKWFTRRAEGWVVGEVVLKGGRVLIPFKTTRIIQVGNVVTWDLNELSLNRFLQQQVLLKSV